MHKEKAWEGQKAGFKMAKYLGTFQLFWWENGEISALPQYLSLKIGTVMPCL